MPKNAMGDDIIESPGVNAMGDPIVPGEAVPGLTPGSPNSGATGRFVSSFASAVNPVPGIRAIATDPKGIRHGIETNIFQPQVDQFSKAGDAARGRGEFAGMTPLERASSFAGHAAAGAIPLVGPAAANAGEQIGSGDIAGGLGSGAGLISTVAIPDLMRAGGRGLSRIAEPIAENALGIRNVDRKFGRTPGRAALDETTGVRPETVVSQAGDRIADLTGQRDAALTAAGNRGVTVPLTSARDIVDSSIARAAAGNSGTGHLAPIQSQLTEPKPGFQGRQSYASGATQPITYQQAQAPSPYGTPAPRVIPGTAPPLTISEFQEPMNALAIRQRLGNDFTKFDMARPVARETQAVGNRAYGALTDEIHNAVPESAPLDRRISNLIPIKEGAATKDIQASAIPRVLGRIARPTGALIGAAEGARLGGIPGAIVALVIPELLSDPTAQMITARGMDTAGKIFRHPITGQIIRGAQD